MAMSELLKTHKSLDQSYKTTTAAYLKSKQVAREASVAYTEAGRAEIEALKRTLKNNNELMQRSQTYRTHYKFIKMLARRLLASNSEIEYYPQNADLDHYETLLLRHGTYCFQLLSAGSQLASMNRQGVQAKAKCDRTYKLVDDARKIMDQKQKEGREACEAQAGQLKKLVALHNEMAQYAATITKAAREEDAPSGVESLLDPLQHALNEMSKFLDVESKPGGNDTSWLAASHNGPGPSIKGLDTRAAQEAEDIYAAFEAMAVKFGMYDAWCPCCGIGHGASDKKKKKGHR